jgi:hypothetical protein
MARGTDECNPGTLAEAQEREAIQSRCIDDGLDFCQQRVEREVGDVSIRKARASWIGPDQRTTLRERRNPVLPHGTRPVDLKMRDPVVEAQQLLCIRLSHCEAFAGRSLIGVASAAASQAVAALNALARLVRRKNSWIS